MEFTKKQSNLLGQSKEVTTKNAFVTEALKESNVTTSGNGAKKYSTSGNDFVDNFAAIATFREPRSYEEVAKDMQLLWSQNPLQCLKLAVYIRLITRKSKVVINYSTKVLDTQRGQGLRNEGILRLLWVAVNHPEVFKANISYFIAAGSWKDLFQMLSLDLQYHGWNGRKLDWNFFYSVLCTGIINPETTSLVQKYMPTIRTNRNCKTLESQADTLIGRWFARKLFPKSKKESAYKDYRKFKSQGQANEWQKLISQQLYDQINFDTIAGRALSLLVGSKFLANHGLEQKYLEWIKSKPVAKYTGYVFELFKPLGNGYHCHEVPEYVKHTINAQFAQLVQTGKDNVNTNSRFLVVRDTSSSMTSTAIGCKVSSYDIAKSLALYFSEFLTGPFANSFAEFNDECVLHQWKGETPVDKYINDRCEAYGSTNFQSVISLFISLKNRGVEEKDFPTGILCLSDGEYDRTSPYDDYEDTITNFQFALKRLRQSGFSEEYVKNFKIVLWDIPNGWYGHQPSVKFEDFADAPNFFYISGMDGSAISFLLGTEKVQNTPKNAEELFNAAMNQTLLNKLTI